MSRDAGARGFLNQVCDELFRHARSARRRMARAYLTGLLFPGNKSVTGIAARVNANADALHHFLANSPWDAQETLAVTALAALNAAARRGLRAVAYALDDTTQRKSGKRSPGVAHQYSGAHGGTTVCQAFPTLHIVFNNGGSYPVGVELFLPAKQWGAERAEAAGVPAELVGLSKAEVGLRLVDAALAAGLPRLPVLADAAFGHSSALRAALDARGIGYVVAVEDRMSFYSALAPASRVGRATLAARVGVRQNAEAWLANEPWEEARGRQFKFQCLRPHVKEGRSAYATVEPRAVHLIGEKVRTKARMRYSVTNMDVREAIVLLGRRWAVERNYRELKQLVGFARYQGRSYDGLTRHLALAAVAHILLFWFTLSKGSSSLYAASRELPAAILLALHSRCPLCSRKLPFVRPG